MNDKQLPSDLPTLRALAAWLQQRLTEVRQEVADAERTAAAEARRPRWWVRWQRRPPGAPRRGTLHEEGCWHPGAPDLDVAALRRLLAEHGDRVAPCEVCRPSPPG
ncbi:hypothetical protein E1265_27695 [Streptomyces sp. 8K308]|uniref:hypothetical protein n=1 Tax=Streptomyces sp. 8K308 TaxID=2530388 RepID=UPI001051A056|nr:hypothetical protein [Streptomyces sp. 8K308]TDC13615.1 hypothetical protein E1265_27695 [Streptomyces sp. 8K308]